MTFTTLSQNRLSLSHITNRHSNRAIKQQLFDTQIRPLKPINHITLLSLPVNMHHIIPTPQTKPHPTYNTQPPQPHTPHMHSHNPLYKGPCPIYSNSFATSSQFPTCTTIISVEPADLATARLSGDSHFICKLIVFSEQYGYSHPWDHICLGFRFNYSSALHHHKNWYTHEPSQLGVRIRELP